MCEWDQFIKLVRKLIFFPSGSTWSKAAHVEEPPPRVQRHQEEEPPAWPLIHPLTTLHPLEARRIFFFAECVMGAGPDLTHISADEEVTVNTRNIKAKMQ